MNSLHNTRIEKAQKLPFSPPDWREERERERERERKRKPKQWKISRAMEWCRKVVFPVRRVWTGVASRLGIRKTGILKLQHDVRACQYEDVHVMWEMLQRNEMDQSPVKQKKRSLWSFFGWARSAPSLSRSF